VRRREVSSVELTRAALARIEAVDPPRRRLPHPLRGGGARRRRGQSIGASPPATTPARSAACRSASRTTSAAGRVRTTAASRILESFVPPYDATVTAKLRHAGAVIVGKTNCDEFAMGSSTENSALGRTRNPWDPTRVPGGSSAARGPAVAAREVPAALGTDTGGSVRLPAAFCGVVGLKPTYGRVSRYGVIAYASSLDQVGPVTARRGRRGRPARGDRWPRPRRLDRLAAPGPRLPGRARRRGARDAARAAREYFVEGMQPEVERAVRAAVRELERLGAVVEEVSLPHTEYAIATYYLIATAEASSNLARYDGVRYGLRVPGQSLGEMYERSRAAASAPR